VSAWLGARADRLLIRGTDAKLDTKHQLYMLNELADLSSCNNLLFFEARRRKDLYLWMSKAPNGPSVRFHLLNAHTMDELKMTGNCLKGSRPIVSFDKQFDSEPHWRVIKELLTHVSSDRPAPETSFSPHAVGGLVQMFAVPKTARRAKPFVDHVANFSIVDGKIWFRNYQARLGAVCIGATLALTDLYRLSTTRRLLTGRRHPSPREKARTTLRLRRCPKSVRDSSWCLSRYSRGRLVAQPCTRTKVRAPTLSLFAERISLYSASRMGLSYLRSGGTAVGTGRQVQGS
jgi:hypothetical protein